MTANAGFTTIDTFLANPTFSGAPTATTQRGKVSIGDGGFTGAAGHFAGHASGTHLAINAASAFAGNPLDVQQNGVSLLSVASSGRVTVTNDLAVSGSIKGASKPPRFALLTITPATDADQTPAGTDVEALFWRINQGAWTVARNVIVPTFTGTLMVLHNNIAALNATFKTAAGTGVTVAATKYCLAWCGGANLIRLTPDT